MVLDSEIETSWHSNIMHTNAISFSCPRSWWCHLKSSKNSSYSETFKKKKRGEGNNRVKHWYASSSIILVLRQKIKRAPYYYNALIDAKVHWIRKHNIHLNMGQRANPPPPLVLCLTLIGKMCEPHSLLCFRETQGWSKPPKEERSNAYVRKEWYTSKNANSHIMPTTCITLYSHTNWASTDKSQ